MFDSPYPDLMAGGQNSSVHRSGMAARFTALNDAHEARQARRTPQHCWITGVPGVPDQTPALLIAWSGEPGKWIGRVVYALDSEYGPRIVHEWVSQDHLRPA